MLDQSWWFTIWRDFRIHLATFGLFLFFRSTIRAWVSVCLSFIPFARFLAQTADAPCDGSRGALGYLRWNFVTKHDSALPSIFSAHPRVLPVPVVARKYDGDNKVPPQSFLSFGFPLKFIVFYGVDVSRVGLCLENIMLEVVALQIAELPTPETLAYLPLSSSTFFRVLHPLEPD